MKEPAPYTNFIRERRKTWKRRPSRAKAMTMTELAEATGINLCDLSQIERHHRKVKLATAEKIARALRADVAGLFPYLAKEEGKQ